MVIFGFRWWSTRTSNQCTVSASATHNTWRHSSWKCPNKCHHSSNVWWIYRTHPKKRLKNICMQSWIFLVKTHPPNLSCRGSRESVFLSNIFYRGKSIDNTLCANKIFKTKFFEMLFVDVIHSFFFLGENVGFFLFSFQHKPSNGFERWSNLCRFDIFVWYQH